MLQKVHFFMGFVIFHIIYSGYTGSQTNFGPFTYHMSNSMKCKGPKRYDCCNTIVKIESGKRMLISMDVKRKFIPNRGKITINVNGKILLRTQIKKPCDDILMRPLFYNLLNASAECEIPKGLYNVSFDVEKLAQDFYGGMFFYGNLTVKSVIYNDNYNFICNIVEAVLSPKDSKSGRAIKD